MCCSTDIFLGCLAVLFPPIAVWIKIGLCTPDSLINLALCTLGYFPGLLHAWYIIAKYPDPEYEYATIPSHDSQHPHHPHDRDHDPESGSTHGGNVTYYYVSQAGPAPVRPQQAGRLRSGESAGSVGSGYGGGGGRDGRRGSQQRYPVQGKNLGVPTGQQHGQQQYGTIGNSGGAAGEASSGSGRRDGQVSTLQGGNDGRTTEQRDEGAVPPSYDQAVRGDNKVQTD